MRRELLNFGGREDVEEITIFFRDFVVNFVFFRGVRQRREIVAEGHGSENGRGNHAIGSIPENGIFTGFCILEEAS